VIERGNAVQDLGFFGESSITSNRSNVKYLMHSISGRGAYFSQSPKYAAQYIKDEKVLQLSWLLLGRVYPVIEPPAGPGTLHGKPCISGFDSHYAVVNQDGIPCRSAEQV